MPVLSLPIPLPGAAGGPMWLPLRIPFPIMRIGSILPASINEPFKNSLVALFKLAWSNKVQLPVLITVCFMAFDIRMQLEINFFWETPRPNVTRQRRSNQRGGNSSSSNINHEALRAAVVTAALLERQRQRLQLQERARQQELAGALNGGRHNFPAIHEGITDSEEDDDDTDTDTLEDQVQGAGLLNGKRKSKRKSGGPTEEDEDEEDSEDDDSDDEDEEDDDDLSDDDNDGGDSPNAGFFGESGGDNDYFSEDNSNLGDGSSDDEDSTGGGTPLVVQLEIHQRSMSTFSTELSNKLSSAFASWSLSSLHFIQSLRKEIVPLIKPSSTICISHSNMEISVGVALSDLSTVPLGLEISGLTLEPSSIQYN